MSDSQNIEVRKTSAGRKVLAGFGIFFVAAGIFCASFGFTFKAVMLPKETKRNQSEAEAEIEKLEIQVSQLESENRRLTEENKILSEQNASKTLSSTSESTTSKTSSSTSTGTTSKSTSSDNN